MYKIWYNLAAWLHLCTGNKNVEQSTFYRSWRVAYKHLTVDPKKSRHLLRWSVFFTLLTLGDHPLAEGALRLDIILNLSFTVPSSRVLEFLGRKLIVPRAAGSLAFFSFDELCSKVSPTVYSTLLVCLFVYMIPPRCLCFTMLFTWFHHVVYFFLIASGCSRLSGAVLRIWNHFDQRHSPDDNQHSYRGSAIHYFNRHTLRPQGDQEKKNTS